MENPLAAVEALVKKSLLDGVKDSSAQNSPASPGREWNPLRGSSSPNGGANRDLEAAVEAQRLQEEREMKLRDLRNRLAGQLLSLWQLARDHRNQKGITQAFLDSERQRNGEYSAEQLAMIRQTGGCEKYYNYTGQKCDSAKALLLDIYAAADGRACELEVETEIELNPAIRLLLREMSVKYAQGLMRAGDNPDPETIEQFKTIILDRYRELTKIKGSKAAERMEGIIQDQLNQGGYAKAHGDFLEYLTTYKIGVMKMEFRQKSVLRWIEDKDGKYKAQTSNVSMPSFEAVDPRRMYFSPNLMELNRGYLFERMTLTRGELQAFKGCPGCKDSEIDAAIAEYGEGGGGDWTGWTFDQFAMAGDKAAIESDGAWGGDVRIDVLKFYGSVSGKSLLDWGVEGVEEKREYNVSAILVGSHVVRAVVDKLIQPESMYYVTSFYKRAGRIYGEGIPERISDLQDLLNANVRAWMNNAAISSGPIAATDLRKVDISKVPLNRMISPFANIPFNSKEGSQGKPFETFTIPNNSEQYRLNVEALKADMDDISNIPRYASGSPNVGGAASTARGLSMLMSQSTKATRSAVKNVTDDIEIPIVSTLYNYNMQAGTDDSAKCPLRVRVKGTFNFETASAREQKLLSLIGMISNSPDAMQMAGARGFAALLRASCKDIGLPESIIPSDEELAAKERSEMERQQAEANAQNQAQQAQAAMMQEKARGERVKPQALLMGAVNNAKDKGIIDTDEARKAYMEIGA